MVVLVGVQVPHDLVSFEALLLQLLQDRLLVEHVGVSHDQALRSVHRLVGVLEPGVRSDLRRRGPLLRVLNHDALDEVTRILADEARNVVLAFEDLLVKLRGVWVLERQEPADEREEDDAAAPRVDLGTDVLAPGDHLRGRIARGSTGRLQGLLLCEGVGEAEVDDFDVLLVIEQQVLRLEVPVDYVEVVHVLDAGDDLLVELAGLFLLQFGVLDDVVEELSTAGVLHDQVELLGRLDDLVQLDDVRVPDLLENVDLPGDSLDIRRICNTVLLQNLDANLLTRQRMSPKFDFTKSTLAN